MQQISDPRPEGPGRRRLPRRPVRIPEGEGADLERYLAEYTDIIDERLEDGLDAIQRSAAKLLRHVAAEVWRASGPQASRNLTESVIGSLAQDDTLRALLTHTDERFQALQVRVADMEGAIRKLAEATREAVGAVNERAPGAQQFERQREEQRRFTARLGQALSEMHRQLTTGLRGEIQRLESAVTSRSDLDDEALRAIRSEVLEATGSLREEVARSNDTLRQELTASRADARDGLADLRDRLRAEIEAAVLPSVERMGNALEGVRTSLDARIREGQERIHLDQQAHRDRLQAFADRAMRGMGEVARRLHAEIASLAERAEETEGRTGERVDRLAEEVHGFRERAASGLTEVGERVREGFRLMLANLETREGEAARGMEEAIRAEVRRVHQEVVDVAERTGTILDGVRSDLVERVGHERGETRKEAVKVVSQIVERQAGRHQETIKGVTRSLRHLLEAVHTSGVRQSKVMERVLRATAQRQEAILDESLAALRASLEELGSTHRSGDTARPEDRGAFTGRLRTVEQRLGELSDELTGSLKE